MRLWKVRRVRNLRVLPAVLLALLVPAISLAALFGQDNIASSSTNPKLATTSKIGYLLASSTGTVRGYGTTAAVASTVHKSFNGPVVAMAAPLNADGYWLATAHGSVLAFGAARSYGPKAGVPGGEPVAAMAVTPNGLGYWLASTNGGVFSFGDAVFHGSAVSSHLKAPIVAMATTADGGGYWLVARDGGTFSFGDAHVYGSAPSSRLSSPVVGIAATPDGKGYWLTTANGRVIPFGSARDFKQVGRPQLNSPIVGIAATPDGRGYWLAAKDGGVLAFGDAVFVGSESGQLPPGQSLSALAVSLTQVAAPSAGGSRSSNTSLPATTVAAAPSRPPSTGLGSGPLSAPASGAGATTSPSVATSAPTTVIGPTVTVTPSTAHPTTTASTTGTTTATTEGSTTPSTTPNTTASTTASTTPSTTTGPPPTGGAGNQTYVHQSGFPSYTEAGTSQAITTGAMGDLVIVLAHHDQTSSSTVTKITDTSNYITWSSSPDVVGAGPEGHHFEMWHGVVNHASGNTTIEVDWNGTANDPFLYVDEWRSAYGSDSVWSVVPGASGYVDTYVTGQSGTCTLPKLTSGADGGLYWGYVYAGSSTEPGTFEPGGFSGTTTGDSNAIIWDGSLANDTSYQASVNQQVNPDWWDGIAAIYQAV